MTDEVKKDEEQAQEKKEEKEKKAAAGTEPEDKDKEPEEAAQQEEKPQDTPGEEAKDEVEPQAEGEKELSEEELSKLVEESLDKVTVADIVLSMMNQLASVAYLKMGIPESVNLKYRDFDQARLAIDSLDAMIHAAEGKVPEKGLQPFKGTLANLQMNFVQLKPSAGSKEGGDRTK